MFTPQRKAAPWTPAPRTEPRASTATALKGKAVAFFDGPPAPPLGSLASESVGRSGADRGNMSDWRRFKEAGLLDESAMEKKDREALIEKVSRLEKELFDYQHNMGLLLIEKNHLVSKNEELGQVVAECHEILKREQTAHLIAISEAEKRGENLKKALDTEKKCVVDLERALRDMREQHAKMKDTSKATMTDINAEMQVLEKKRVELEAKSVSVNAKLDVVDRKTYELDRKLKNFEAHENILKMERVTLTQEREAHESCFRKQKEDLVEWERKLQEAEQRLCDSRKSLNDREEKLRETDKISKEKESTLVELQRKIDLANATLKKMDDDISNQSTELSLKEKRVEAMRCSLEIREKELKEKEEMLDKRERVELEKLLSEQKAILDAKTLEFELDMKQRRKSTEEELESRKQAVAHRETEIKHLEVKLSKREQALEKKSERVKEREKDVELKVKGLKEREKCLKAEEKQLLVEKEQLKADKERLEELKEKIQVFEADMKKQEMQIEEEREKLGNVEAEKSEYLRLQLNLKKEMENVRRQNEQIEKDAEELKFEREKIERDWEALDEKRAIVDKELKMLSEEKTSFEKLQNEEERLKKQKTENEELIRQERENIKLERESFEATKKHEELMLSQKAENERSLMLQEYEQRREDLEKDMQKKENEREKSFREKERLFEETKSREMRNVIHLKEDAQKRKEETESEILHLEKEKKEIELNKKQLQESSIEISKDIEALKNLSDKLKSQRELFVSERTRFGNFIDKIKSCKNCGDSAQEFLHKLLQLPSLDGSSDLPRQSRIGQKATKDELSPLGELTKKTSSSGVNKGQMSIVRKCVSLISHLSPNKDRPDEDSIVNDLKYNNFQSDVIVKEDNKAVSAALSVDDSNIDSEAQSIQESEVSDLKKGQKNRPASKYKTSKISRTNTIKTVIEEAKAFIGETSKGEMEDPPKDYVNEMANGRHKTVNADLAVGSLPRKRTRGSQASRMTESEQDVENSEGKADDSVTTGGRKKRRQTSSSAALLTPGQRRYNLRRHTTAGKANEEQHTSGDKTKHDDGLSHKGNNQPSQNIDDAPAQSLDITVDSERKLHAAEVSTPRSMNCSSDRIIRFDTIGKAVDSSTLKSVENTALSGEVNSAQDTLLSEGTSENVDEGDNRRSILNDNEEVEDGEDDDDDDSNGDANDDDSNGDAARDDDDDDGHPGQPSVGKTIWKFLTT